MNEENIFHVKDGLFFERLPDGQVKIRKTIEKIVGSNKGGAPFVVLEIILTANEWASVIASMSYYGEEDNGFYRAMNFHCGDAIPASCPLVDKLNR